MVRVLILWGGGSRSPPWALKRWEPPLPRHPDRRTSGSRAGRGLLGKITGRWGLASPYFFSFLRLRAPRAMMTAGAAIGMRMVANSGTFTFHMPWL